MTANMTRRQVLGLGAAGVSTALLADRAVLATPGAPAPPRLPRRISWGARAALINPASAMDGAALQAARANLAQQGFQVVVAPHAGDQYGYLAGTDEDRAADVNRMFGDPNIDCIFAARGGWGCARILDLLDYELIRANPKVISGYSDITALLLAITARTGLVTFHGPVASSTWNDFSRLHFARVVIEREAAVLRNPADLPHEVIRGGRASGRLLGGNLSVLSALLGSPHLPDWDGAILFLEDVDEPLYRIDRMLTHLALAGLLDRLAGFVFAQCTRCPTLAPDGGESAMQLRDILNDHVRPLRIPAWLGAPVGHVPSKFTLPIGLPVSIDADAGTITLDSSAVL